MYGTYRQSPQDAQVKIPSLKKKPVNKNGNSMYINVSDNCGNRNINLDFGILGSILIQAKEYSNTAIINAAFIIGEMASNNSILLLIQAAKNNNLRLLEDENTTVTDIITQIWIQDCKLLERFHAEIIARRPREFQYFQGNLLSPKPPISHSYYDFALQVECDLNKWFFKNNCSSSCKVFFFHKDEEIRILIKQHPEKYDVLVYNTIYNTIAVSTGTIKWQKQAYLRIIGQHLFDSDDYFLHRPQYTLDPIRENGAASLYSSDIDGIDSIKLTEVLLYSNDDYGTKRTLSSADLFTSREFHDAISHKTQISSATFALYFSGSNKARLVTITLPHTVACAADDVPAINTWLKARGFLITEENA